MTSTRISLLLTAAAALAVLTAAPHAQLGPGSPAPVPVERRGLAVSDRIPTLDLVDQAGRRQTLDTLAGPNGLVLLFVRSADW